MAVNAFPDWWTSNITVFVSVVNDDTGDTMWGKWHMSGCYWGETEAGKFASEDLWRKNRVTVRIPHSAAFVPYGEYVPNGNSITIDVLNPCLIVRGSVDDAIEDNENCNALYDKYAPNAIIVETFKDNSDLASVGAWHYHVTGG